MEFSSSLNKFFFILMKLGVIDCHWQNLRTNRIWIYNFIFFITQQVNPTYTSLDLVAYCQSQGIVVIASSPLGYLPERPFAVSNVSIPPTFQDPTLVKIADKYGKQTNQVAIRYLVILVFYFIISIFFLFLSLKLLIWNHEEIFNSCWSGKNIHRYLISISEWTFCI